MAFLSNVFIFLYSIIRFIVSIYAHASKIIVSAGALNFCLGARHDGSIMMHAQKYRFARTETFA